MKFSFSLLQLVLASTASAAMYDGSIGSGPGPSELQNVVSQNRDPDATKSVPASGGWGISVDSNDGGKSPSTRPSWRINITDIPVTDAQYSNGANIPNAQVVNTVYDLDWNSDQSLPDTLETAQQEAEPNNSSSKPYLCATIFSNFFPANVTNAINSTSDSTSDSCGPSIGQDCLNAILFSSMPGSGNATCNTYANPMLLPACHGTFVDSSATTILLSDPGNGGNGSFPLHSGTGFWYDASEAHDGLNRTYFDQQDLKLHMMILETQDVSYAMCTRVNATVDAKGAGEGVIGGEGAAGKAMVASVSVVMTALAFAVGMSF